MSWHNRDAKAHSGSISSAKGSAKSCDWKGPGIANLEGYTKHVDPLRKSTGKPLNGFKQGSGIVIFSF